MTAIDEELEWGTLAVAVSLPIWPDMSAADVDRVIARVRFHLTGRE